MNILNEQINAARDELASAASFDSLSEIDIYFLAFGQHTLLALDIIAGELKRLADHIRQLEHRNAA